MRFNPFHPVRWLALLALVWGLATAHPTALPATQAAPQSPNIPSKVGDLKWHTFLGGADRDYANAITLSPSGDLFVAGNSNASWGNPLRPYAGGFYGDAFVARLDANGTLKWHTFLGGAGYDYGSAMTLSPSGDLFVAGGSGASWGNPLRPHEGGGNSDAFVARLDANGTLKWHAFLGGASGDGAKAITLSPSDDLFVAGSSNASWGNPLRPHGGWVDAFVARLDANGNLKWHPFLGGANEDSATAIALSPSGDLFVAGSSEPIWGNPLRPHAGRSDAFVARLDANGNLKWHTFLGGASWDGASDITLSPSSDLFLAGYSYASWGNPLRPYTGDLDAFVARLDANGNLKWHTFLGGATYDEATAMTLSPSGDLFMAGESKASWGTPLRTHAGDGDAFVARLELESGTVYLPLGANQLLNATEPPPTVIPPTPTPTPPANPCIVSDCREPNNSIGQAAQISVNESVLASVNANGDENDYYRVTLQAGKRYTVRLNFSGNADLDLYIYGPDQREIIKSKNEGPVPEEVIVRVSKDDVYYVLVSAFASNGPQQYELVVGE
ncbi:MAG: pre-peptidase C-terminal domain-containing protein [Anaerolineae bacterium]|nr:pre-peptidase C-terminal domain-containing protein [Anaerolineae bacterium]